MMLFRQPRSELIPLPMKHVQNFNSCSVNPIVKHVVPRGKLAHAGSEAFRRNSRFGLPRNRDHCFQEGRDQS